ncbi:MAG: FAD-binding protein [Chitinophagales bacterium]
MIANTLPFVAIREYILSRKTLGGIQTNLNGAVLDQNGNTIEGLCHRRSRRIWRWWHTRQRKEL